MFCNLVKSQRFWIMSLQKKSCIVNRIRQAKALLGQSQLLNDQFCYEGGDQT